MTGSDSLKSATAFVLIETTSIFSLWPTSASEGMYVLGGRVRENGLVGRNALPALQLRFVIRDLLDLQIRQILDRHPLHDGKVALLLHRRRRRDNVRSTLTHLPQPHFT